MLLGRCRHKMMVEGLPEAQELLGIQKVPTCSFKSEKQLQSVLSSILNH